MDFLWQSRALKKSKHYEWESSHFYFSPSKMRRIKQRLISTCPQLPYLSEIFNEEFSNVIIKSEDGNEIRINHLFMASWSKFSKELLSTLFFSISLL